MVRPRRCSGISTIPMASPGVGACCCSTPGSRTHGGDAACAGPGPRLGLGASSDDPGKAVPEAGDAAAVFDLDGVAHGAYGIEGDPALVLVRPDGPRFCTSMPAPALAPQIPHPTDLRGG